jgi:hypothetical protein
VSMAAPTILYIKVDVEFEPPKAQGISYLERERAGWGERERWASRRAGHKTGRFKVMLGLGEIEGRGRNREIKIQRDRADNKNPEPCQVAQLVSDKNVCLCLPLSFNQCINPVAKDVEVKDFVWMLIPNFATDVKLIVCYRLK